jgi:hypothetical protein
MDASAEALANSCKASVLADPRRDLAPMIDGEDNPVWMLADGLDNDAGCRVDAIARMDGVDKRILDEGGLRARKY